MATGLIRTTAGHGFRTKTSGGLRIITVAGRILPITAGSGLREATSIGGRRGSHGERGAITLAGRLCLHAVPALFMKDSLSALGWTSNTISARNITTFVTFALSVNRSCGIEFFRQHRTLRTSRT